MEMSQFNAGKKPAAQVVFDLLFWVVSVFVAVILRLEFSFDRLNPFSLLALGVSIAFLHFFVGLIGGLYRDRFVLGSFDEFANLFLTSSVAAFPAAAWGLVFGPEVGIPRSVVFIAVPIFFLLSGSVRFFRRLRLRHLPAKNPAKRAIIFGAGSMGEVVVSELLSNPSRSFQPVGLLDDDPQKKSRWISGIKMQGTLKDLPQVSKRLGADALIVAVPRADSVLLERVRSLARESEIEVVILPSFSELLAGLPGNFVLSKLGIEDLVGRRAVTIDSQAIKDYLEDRTILITGAGGSIGVELCRQVARYSPARVFFLDRDETGLQQAELAVSGKGFLSDATILLADIRDADVVHDLFSKAKPDVVFHAAALKHLPALERFPREAWRTNVLGTANVLSAAAHNRVSHFVNISTDKAADPSSVLGRSKKLAEQLTSWYDANEVGNYQSVRFGNVLGSRGSLVPTLEYLIDVGGPIHLTDPEATRFFMTVSEACQLVLQAGTETSASSIFLLDMGNPVKILDIANRMIEMSGKNIEIRYQGLRPGEKLEETLVSFEERLEASSHDLIWRINAQGLPPSALPNLERDFLG